jgi:hypothetical protein
MITASNLVSNGTVSGVFGVVEVDGGFSVRDPYGNVDSKVFTTRDRAERCSAAANKAMQNYNNGARISHGGDI